MSRGTFENEMGITVKQLKEIVKDWPETDTLGEDSEVWIMTGETLSSPVVAISPLNSADLMLEPGGY